MLMQYKKDYEKTAMGLLSLLPDFKNLKNLRQEMRLYKKGSDFKLFLFRHEQNTDGVIAVEDSDSFFIIRYLSLAPGYREKRYEREVMKELSQVDSHKRIAAVPEYSYLLKYLDDK